MGVWRVAMAYETPPGVGGGVRPPAGACSHPPNTHFHFHFLFFFFKKNN
jgi:hypothetical protein